MDFSKMSNEQLLEYLKNTSPKMYSALTTPLDHPGDWSDGEIPINYADYFGYGNTLQNTIGRGYDSNILVEDALNNYKDYPGNDQDKILYGLNKLSNGLRNDPTEKSFPSDSYDPLMFLEEEYPGMTVAQSLGINESDYPAANSANIFNSLTDEELMNTNLGNSLLKKYFRKTLPTSNNSNNLSDDELLKYLEFTFPEEVPF